MTRILLAPHRGPISRLLSILALPVGLGLGFIAVAAVPRGVATAFAAEVAAVAASTGPGDTLLAEFKGGVITPTEFTAAYRQLMPNERPTGTKLEARRTFLVRMVDRKLLAAEATRTPVTLTSSEEAQLEQAREQMIQNELFAELTAGMPSPTDAEIEAFRRQRTHLAEIRFITFPEFQPARSWRMKLSTGTPITALDELIARGGPNAPQADSFRVVAADQIPDTLATVIWAMRPGQVSDVHSFAGHPVLIHVRNFTPRPGAGLNPDDLTIRTDWQRRQYDRVRQRIRVDLATSINRTFVDPGMNVLLAGFLKLPPRSDVDSVTGMPVMRANLPLPVFTAADTGLILARTTKGELNLVSYLRYWGRVAAFARPEVREREVLEATVDRVLLEDQLVDMGIARGLDKSPRVLRELDQMREGFALDHFYEERVASKVEVDEPTLQRYFDSKPGHYDDPATMQARILVVDRRDLADSLLALIRGGQSFADLAKEWSTDGNTGQKGGMTGIIAKGTNTNVGLEDAMFATAVGALGGPEHTPEGYVIWKVETFKPGRKRTLDEAREWVVRDYKTLEGEKVLAGVLEELREKAKAKIYPERVTLELGRGGDWGD